jgi:tetratricopeptide (TPR) repeat protein
MDLRDELQVTLGGGFTVERELGGGGMSRVFVAHDVSLGRDVVVKVLPPDLSAEVSVERFRREIQVGAQLQHPHIVPLLSAGASRALLFYSMPFVAGESLRERMSRGPALSCSESVRIWRDVLDALSYAHSRGIVHRDIKPENILLSNKHALVTDFGIARAIEAAAGDARMTSTGLALGTPAYMAPEQAAGDRNVDARADLYSAGLVMYEMLAGHPPFVANSARQMVAAQLTQEAPPLTARDSSTPKGMIGLVMRCLAKDPSARPTSAESVLETLDSFVGGGRTTLDARPKRITRLLLGTTVALVIAAGGIGAWSVRAGHLPFATPAIPPNDTLRLTVVIVATKFDSADANLGSSFRDDMVSELMKEPWLRMIPPGIVDIAMRLAGFDVVSPPRDTVVSVMKRLHTNAYVDLTVSRAGTGFVFSARAMGAADDNSVGTWSAAANTAAEAPEAIRRVAANVRRALLKSRRALPATAMAGFGGDAASVAEPLVLEAWSEMSRGNFVEALDKARKAVRTDSTLYPARQILYLSLGNAGAPASEQVEAVSAAYRLRDRIRSPLDRVLLDADYFRYLGRDAEALAAFDSAARMLPAKFPDTPPRALLYLRMRRYDIAAKIARDAIDTTYSRLDIMNSRLVNALLSLGKVNEAKAEYHRMLTHTDSSETNARVTRYFIATATRDWAGVTGLASEELADSAPGARRRGQAYARDAAAVQGQLARYDSLMAPVTDRTRATQSGPTTRGVELPRIRVHIALGDVAGARAMIETRLTTQPWESLKPLDRPHAAMITALALVGDTTRGTAIAADWTAHVPQQYKLRDSLAVLAARSELALARGNPKEALRLLRTSDVKNCRACVYPRYARVFDALHMPDSVVAYYEKFATATSPEAQATDAYELARAYRRLGEIYEQRHDWQHAKERYQDFVNLWEHADSALQPVVKDVRARIERIRAHSG